jgi:hypothetical protein
MAVRPENRDMAMEGITTIILCNPPSATGPNLPSYGWLY